MKRILILFSLIGFAISVTGQKSRVLSVFQMIDAEKYTEAKEAIELAAWNDKTSRWARTYYARGLLCQTAYEDGYKKNDPRKTGLYPDQLFLAYQSYERAVELDKRGRLHHAIAQNYYSLSNDFRILGEEHFTKKEYEKALRAFEHALLVNNSKLINAKIDTNLVYNTAIAAYENRSWGKAIGYLTGLHEDAFDPATSLLLYQAHMAQGDSARAEEVLLEALEYYNYNDQVVIYLINLLVNTNRMDMALNILDEALNHHPGEYLFLWSRGLIFRRLGKQDEAIENFKAALEMEPGEPKIYYHIGVIYYNMGIELKEASRQITDSDEYQAIKVQSRERFMEAVNWLEKAYEIDPSDEETISKLYQLYYQLKMKEKEESLKQFID